MDFYVTLQSSSSASVHLPNNKPSNCHEPHPIVQEQKHPIKQNILSVPSSNLHLILSTTPHSHTPCKAKPQQQKDASDTPNVTSGFRLSLFLHEYESTNSPYAESWRDVDII